MAAERARQNRLDEESFALSEAARARYDGAPEQMAERETSLGDLYRETAEAAPARPMASAPPTSSNITTSAIEGESARTSAESEDMRRRRAKAMSFGDMFGDMSIAQGRDAGRIGQIGGFKRGSQNVLPLELDGAASRGSGWMMLGDLLNMAGGVATTRALIDPASLAAMFGQGAAVPQAAMSQVGRGGLY